MKGRERDRLLVDNHLGVPLPFTHPRGVNALDQSACAFIGLHCDLKHTIDIDVVAVDEVVAHRLRWRPADEHALVQLPFQR